MVFLVKISDQVIEIDSEAQKALHFIQTGTFLTKKTRIGFYYIECSDSNAYFFFRPMSTTNPKLDHSSFSLCTYANQIYQLLRTNYLFFQLCEMESIAAFDDVFKNDLTLSRLNIAVSYLSEHFLKALLEQLSQVCASAKWHARRAAIEFTQSMIFSNLFNARPYTQQLHQLLLNSLLDEQYEVRTAASITLSGFYQCGYIQVTLKDLVGEFSSSDDDK